jgi:hypothetical protein
MLSGVCRFNILSELSSTRGYRVVVPDWSPFQLDYEEIDIKPASRKMFDGILRQYTEQKALKVDWDVLDELPTLRLMNSLVGVLPLATSDKQILLETIDTDRRLEIFSAILKAQSSSNRTVSH